MTVPQFGSSDLELEGVAGAKNSIAVDGGARAASVLTPSRGSAALDRSLVHGIAWLGSVKWIVQLITWTTTIAVARILTPADYGLLSMGAVLLTFISLLSESGIGTTVIQTRGITPEQIAQINGGGVLLGTICFATACAFALPVGWFYHQAELPGVIIAMSFILIISAFRVVPAALLRRDLRFAPLALIDGVQGLVQAVATILLAKAGFRYWSLVSAALLGALVGTGATVLARPYRIKLPRWDTLRPMLPFTRQVLIGRLMWYAYQDSDFVVAGKRLGSTALGAYSYGWTLASMPVDKITALIGAVTAPVFAAVQHDRLEMKRYFLTVTEGLAVLAFPLTIGMALVASDLVPFVLGPRWSFMAMTLQVLAAYASIRTIAPIASQMLTAAGDARFLMYLGAIGVVAFPAGFYIGSHWGMLGIAIAWMIVHPLVVYFPVTVRAGWRLNMPLTEYLRALWPAVSSCLLMMVAVVGVRAAVPSSMLLGVRLVVEVAAGAIVYAGALVVFHRARLAGFLSIWRNRGAAIA